MVTVTCYSLQIYFIVNKLYFPTVLLVWYICGMSNQHKTKKTKTTVQTQNTEVETLTTPRMLGTDIKPTWLTYSAPAYPMPNTGVEPLVLLLVGQEEARQWAEGQERARRQEDKALLLQLLQQKNEPAAPQQQTVVIECMKSKVELPKWTEGTWLKQLFDSFEKAMWANAEPRER